jgi:hypothetical protein
VKKKDIRDRLFKVVSDFSGPQIEEPLPTLEQWEHVPESPDNRRHPRKDVPIYAIFDTLNGQFRASAKNISEGGVLIDPETDLSLNEFIHMTFFHRKFNIPAQTNGKVVRIDSNGVGIQFNKILPVISDL